MRTISQHKYAPCHTHDPEDIEITDLSWLAVVDGRRDNWLVVAMFQTHVCVLN